MTLIHENQFGVRQRWLPAKNVGTQAIPPYAVVEVTGQSDHPVEGQVWTVKRPTSSEPSVIAANGPTAIPAPGSGTDGYGRITFDDPFFVLLDSGTSVSVGTELGAQTDSFEAASGSVLKSLGSAYETPQRALVQYAAGASSSARLVELDMTKPAYETVSGATITTYMPSGTGTVYSRDASTGQLTLGADTVNIVNAAPRIYDPDTSRGRAVLAVPVQGGGYVPIPMATDPFTPAAMFWWYPTSSAGHITCSGVPSGSNNAYMDDGNYTFGTNITNTNEHYASYVRGKLDRIYFTRGGHYLVHVHIQVNIVTHGTQDTETYETTNNAGHTHFVDVKVPIWHAVSYRLERVTGTKTAGIMNGSFFNGYFHFVDTTGLAYTNFDVSYESSFFDIVRVDKDASMDERAVRPNVAYKGGGFTGTTPTISPQVRVTVIPLSMDNTSDDSQTDAEMSYNPWSSGSYQWWGTGTEPT